MKEKLVEILKLTSYYPRKILDFFLFHFYLKQRNDWNILKIFSNKPVLIVGNGPSLNNTPLEKLKNNFVTIGMNKINLIYEKSSWRPDIIACVNGFVINQNKEYFNKTTKVLILPTRAFYLGIKPRKNILFVNLEFIKIINLKKNLAKSNPTCKKCNKKMKSKGQNQGFQCIRCGKKNMNKIIIEIPRKIKKQLYLPKISAHRHLSRPLQRSGIINKPTKFDDSLSWFYVYEN